MSVAAVLVVACVVGVAGVVTQSLILWNFLQKTPIIADENDLDRFKKVARLGMYLTLVMLPAMLTMIICSMIIAVQKGLAGLVPVLLISAVLFAAGKLGKRIEVRAQSLDTASEELETAYHQITEAWMKKVFPDF